MILAALIGIMSLQFLHVLRQLSITEVLVCEVCEICGAGSRVLWLEEDFSFFSFGLRWFSE